MISGLSLDRNCEHVQFSKYELVGRRGRKGHERCSCSSLIPRQAVLQQCRLERGLTVISLKKINSRSVHIAQRTEMVEAEMR